MDNKLPTTLLPLVPPYLVETVSRLLTSKHSFLDGRKRSSAGLTELQTRYAQLEQYWADLTWSEKTRAITTMRSEARNISKDLQRSEESVTSDLELQYDREWRRTDDSLQSSLERVGRTKQTYEADNANYQQRKSAWEHKWQTEKSDLFAFGRTLRSEHTALAEQYTTELSTLETRLQTLNGIFAAYGSGKLPDSELSWTERRQSLGNWRSDLEQRKQHLQQKRQDLERRKQRLSELRQSEYQTSEKLSPIQSSLKATIRNCKTLKAELVAQGILKAEDYPDIPLPFGT